MRVPATRAILYEFGQLKMGVVLIKWAWPRNFRAHYCYNPTIVIILDPPLHVLHAINIESFVQFVNIQDVPQTLVVKRVHF